MSALQVLDDLLRPRVRIDEAAVREYATNMKAGVVFPPVLVFEADGQYFMADGYHRAAAAQLNGLDTIVAEVRPGTRDEALWLSCSANRTNGLHRTNADKRRSVRRALMHPRGQRLSDRQIARHCGVHHHTVGRQRHELEESGAIRRIAERDVQRGASAYRQRVDGISRSNVLRFQAQGPFEALADKQAQSMLRLESGRAQTSAQVARLNEILDLLAETDLRLRSLESNAEGMDATELQQIRQAVERASRAMREMLTGHTTVRSATRLRDDSVL